MTLLYHINLKLSNREDITFHVEADTAEELFKAIQQFRAFEKLSPPDEEPPLH